MNFLYLFPFTYFFNTRLRNDSLYFHLVFEWMAAVVLVLIVGATSQAYSLLYACLSYFAFISLYEIGYMINDIYSSGREVDGRRRGPDNVNMLWFTVWCLTRLGVFVVVTYLMGMLFSFEWWSFFLSMCLVFGLHNFFVDRELKVMTFLWLSWFRFMAPLIFIVHDSQRMGIALAAAMTYVSFRMLGYLDSKGLLEMPSRKDSKFRLYFFLMPIVGVLALWPYEEAYGFVVLMIYYAISAGLGTIFVTMLSRVKSES